MATWNFHVQGQARSVGAARRQDEARGSGVLLRREDRATEWSGISDKAEVNISIYDVTIGRRITNATVGGRSPYFTFGGDHPQDILAWAD
jgi:hypothetical protein